MGLSYDASANRYHEGDNPETFTLSCQQGQAILQTQDNEFVGVSSQMVVKSASAQNWTAEVQSNGRWAFHNGEAGIAKKWLTLNSAGYFVLSSHNGGDSQFSVALH
ncbi:hypothetical protein SG34_030250 [Thalassomonas viridans]|uniref:Uncharacterized protein n=1 Tax=Thalassomonas viridans TaxID=137584 RepID=A0AAF0CF46_9GAMM|nr:hypothetical protein [Thalassomonas viridans]WDE09059.1 hypothetical protein SG34_030250 [Thalassomonas viridans]